MHFTLTPEQEALRDTTAQDIFDTRFSQRRPEARG